MKHKKLLLFFAIILLIIQIYALSAVRSIPLEQVVAQVPVISEPQKPIELAPTPIALAPIKTVTPVKKTVTTKQAGIADNEIEAIVNNQRQDNGLTRLKSNEKLRSSACAKARYMFDYQYWAHNAPDGTTPWSFIRNAGYVYTFAGENLAKGFNTATGTVNGWMNSAGHRANMLNTNYIDQGICSVSGEFNGETVTITVQHLAAQ